MSEKKTEWTYWTDKVAELVKKRADNNPVLKEIVKKNGYIVYDEKSPSGPIHVGSARGWVIHDVIAKTMREHGMKGRFVLSNDDMDPMDSLPKQIDQEKYKKYMGTPLRNVPSPKSGYKSYADYFFRQCAEKFDDFNIEAELESTGDRYIRGDFNNSIKTILDNADKIQKIYLRLYGKTIASEKLPFQPICEKCGKIGTTFAYEWDSKREVVKYECMPDLVKWAKGCGHKGEISPYNGGGKLPWKAEWAAKWPTVGVVCELAGKDHFTKGGSRSVAIAISCEILNYPPPWPSTCENIGKGYEFFLVGGKKMSTSKGIGASFVEMSEMVPPEMLRFLMVKSRPETTIDFTPEGDTIPFLFNEFDRIESIYFGLEDASDHDKVNAKRVYELSVATIPNKKPYRILFDFAAMLVQTLPEKDRFERVVKILKKIGHVESGLTKLEKGILKNTLRYADIWAKNFATERTKITLLEKMPKEIIGKVDEKQKQALKELGEFLKSDRSDKEIWDQIRNIADKLGIKPQKIFQAAYIVLLGKNYGPRLVPFIQSLDRDFVAKRFKLEE